MIIGGINVFHYQQIACLAQEGARCASVRGSGFQRDTDCDSPTTSQILEVAIQPLAVTLNPEKLEVKVEWIDQASGIVYDWDPAEKYVTSVTPQGNEVTNTVRVTVSYQFTQFLFGGGGTMKATCEIPLLN
jgi:hypothetical protein